MKKFLFFYVIFFCLSSFVKASSNDSVLVKDDSISKIFIKVKDQQYLINEGIPQMYKWNDDSINLQLLEGIKEMRKGINLKNSNYALIGLGLVSLGSMFFIETNDVILYSIVGGFSATFIINGIIGFNNSNKYFNKSKITIGNAKKMIENNTYIIKN